MHKMYLVRRLFIIVATCAQIINAICMLIARNPDSWPTDVWSDLCFYADIGLWIALGMMITMFAILGILDLKYNFHEVKGDEDCDGVTMKFTLTQLALMLPFQYSIMIDDVPFPYELKCQILQVLISGPSPVIYYRVLVLFNKSK